MDNFKEVMVKMALDSWNGYLIFNRRSIFVSSKAAYYLKDAFI